MWLFGKKEQKVKLTAAEVVAGIGQTADVLNVDSEERLKMMHRGLVDFPELLAALPEIDVIGQVKDLEIINEEVTETKEEEEHCYQVSKFLADLRSVRFYSKDVETRKDVFVSYSYLSTQFALATVNSEHKITAVKLKNKAKELGFISGEIPIHGTMLKFGVIEAKGEGVFSFGGDSHSSKHKYLRWNEALFLDTYEKLAVAIIKEANCK